MDKIKIADKITDDLVTIVAIVAIVVLAYSGVTNFEVISIIATLGGYRLYKNREGKIND